MGSILGYPGFTVGLPWGHHRVTVGLILLKYGDGGREDAGGGLLRAVPLDKSFLLSTTRVVATLV